MPRPHSELRALLGIGGPLAAAQLSQMLMASSNVAVLGHLGSTALAGGGLGVALASSLLLVTQGLLAGLQPLVARHRDHPARRGEVLGGALLLALLASIPVLLALLHAGLLLHWAGVAPELAEEAAQYCSVYAWGVPFGLCVGCLRYYLVAIERSWLVMAIAFAAAMLNSALSWTLAFGGFGLAAHGVAGTAFAMVLTWGAMLLALAGFGMQQRLFARPVSDAGWPGRLLASARQVFGMGWPIAVSYASEMWLFLLFSMLVANLGLVALSVNQLTINLVNLAFMVPLALSQAATIRVAYHSGRNAPLQAGRAARVALLIGAVYAGACALLLLLAPTQVLGSFVAVTDPHFSEMSEVARQVFRFAALYVVCDALQSIAAGALRGTRQTRVPMSIVVVGYWGFAFPAGLLLARADRLGISGMWLGLSFAACGVAVMMIRQWRKGAWAEMSAGMKVSH